MIVVDASAAVAALLRSGPARSVLATEAVHVPHLIDTELVDAMRKLVNRAALEVPVAAQALSTWGRIGVRRHPTFRMIDRLWELRSNLSAYDAAYVALSEALDCRLVTADRRLAAATGPRCPIEVVPR